MKIFVKVKSGVKNEKVEKIDENHFVVSVSERPIKGQANRGVMRVMADYFKISKSEIKMTSGFTSSQKTLEI